VKAETTRKLFNAKAQKRKDAEKLTRIVRIDTDAVAPKFPNKSGLTGAVHRG
jgi:hypothetical protein